MSTQYSTILLALASLSAGHLFLKDPAPFAKEGDGYLNPLAPDLSNYPCKQPASGGYVAPSVGSTKIQVGQSYNLQWEGVTTHGGGSCQLSVTYDQKPTKDSVFKVIKTWEGGCPIASDNGAMPVPVGWEMPADVQNGAAVLAWTWMPRLSAAAELYMNCAPIEISGASDDASGYNSLPDIYLPNVNAADCKRSTTSVQNLKIPNPGNNVVRGGEQYGFVDAEGSGCSSIADANPLARGGSAPAPKPAPPASSSAAAPAPTPYTPPTDTGLDNGRNRGFSASAPQPSSAAPAPAAPSAPAAPPAPTTPQTPAAPETPATPPTTGANATCSTDGAIVCNGDREFALCNFGKVETWMRTADGTVCRDGKITESESYAGGAAVRAKRVRRHLAMHKSMRSSY